MYADEVRRLSTTPVGAPAYPSGRYRFTGREYLNILYRTDAEAMRALVPEPLTVADPLVKFEVMRMPDVTGLGSFTESGQVLQVEHDGEPADYLHAMYVDSPGLDRQRPGDQRLPEEVRHAARSTSTPTPWWARSTTAPSGWRRRRWATSTSR